MADYPMPKFHFQVEWGGSKIGFTEVSGLDFETEMIEYRHGASPEYSKTRQPGLVKLSNVTFKRGYFKGDDEYSLWYKKNVMFDNPERRDITISLLNEEHSPAVVWKLKNAWITKLQSTDLKADGNEIAIESIEVVHEGMTVQNDG